MSKQYKKLESFIINSTPGESYPEKIVYIEGEYKGILQKKGTPYEVIIKPGETKHIENHTVGFGVDTPGPTFEYDKNDFRGTLNLQSTKVENGYYTEGAPKDFDEIRENIETNYYDANGVLIETTYSWDNSGDHQTIQIEGYIGELPKVDVEKTSETTETNPDGSYQVIRVWQARYAGTLYEEVWVDEINNIGYYSGSVSKEPEYGYQQDYEGPGQTDDYKMQNLGESINQEFVKDPVNIILGNYYCKDTDLKLEDHGPSLEIIRYYNSLDDRTGILGKSWRINYESTLEKRDGGEVAVTYPDGHSVVFSPVNGTNRYEGPPRIFDVVYKNVDNTYNLKQKNKITYKYDDKGKLIAITDKNSNTLTIEYNGSGNLYRVISASGKTLTFTYQSGSLERIVDSGGREIIYSYDNNDNLQTVTKPGGGVIKYGYNDYGIIDITDEKNVKYIQNEYGEFGRIIEQRDFNDRVTLYSYNELDMTNSFTDIATGKTLKCNYDERFYTIKKTYDDGEFEEFTYDELGNKDSIRDREGNITTFNYDTRGNLLSITSPPPYNYKTTYEYDSHDNLKKINSPDGGVRSFEYDGNNNLVKVREKIDQSTDALTKYSYNIKGQVLTREDAEGNIVQFQYDGDGNLIKIRDPEDNEIEFGYDNLGRRISETTDYGTITYDYNELDKIEKITDASGSITRMKYNILGNLAKLIRPEQYNQLNDDGLGLTYEYDEMDRLTKEINPLGHISAFMYDEEGNKIKDIDSNNYTGDLENDMGTRYEYDSNNRLIKITDQSMGKTRIKYDRVGNKTEIINAKYYNEGIDDGKGLKYIYNSLNRLIKIQDDEGNIIKKYVYDEAGKIIKEIDAKGYLSGSNDEDRYGIEYKYNLIGWPIEKRTPLKDEGGQTYYRVEKYVYDKNGRIIEEKKSPEHVTLAGEPTQYFTIQNTYDKRGNVKTITDSNGAHIEYSYDKLGNLTQQKTKINDTAFQIRGFEYDSLGRIKKKWLEIDSSDLAEGIGETTKSEIVYEYDKNNNITKVTSPEGYITTFEYDDADNLIKKKEEVKVDSLTMRQGRLYISSDRDVVYPGQNYEYEVIVEPDEVIKSSNIEIDYDSRVFELIDAQGTSSSIQANTLTTGKITIDISNLDIATKTKVVTLRMRTKDVIQGFGFVEIKPSSNYVDSQGAVQNYSEIIGKIVYVQIPDMNTDNLVEVRDFTLTALQKGIKLEDLSYNEKFDIDNSGLLDKPDLDYIKDWIFHDKMDYLQKIEALKYGVKHRNIPYTIGINQGIRETIYKYDKVGNPIEEIDCNNNNIVYSYDELYRLKSVKDKEGGLTRIFYDKVGNRVKEILPENYDSLIDDGKGRTYKYDYKNRLTEIRDEEGNIVQENIYDLNGNVIEKIDASGHGIEYIYDIGNRIKTITTPESKTNLKTSGEYSYDALDNVIRYKDGEGNATIYERNMWGKPIKIIDGADIETTYKYDYAGNLIESRDGNKKVTKYKYNSMNLLKEITDPYNDQINYRYDRQGRITQHVDRKGQTIQYGYNPDDSMIIKQVEGTEEIEKYLYNLDGTMLGAINNTQIDTFEYNKRGQLNKKYKDGKPELTYSYNLNGYVDGIINSHQEKIDYIYDTIGRLQGVAYKGKDAALYSYNLDSTVKNIQYDTGINIDYQYTKDKDIKAITVKNPAQEIITQSSYQYDNNRNLILETKDNKTTTYQYDKVNRLEEVLYPTNITERFKYDNAGNRKERTCGLETTTYIYDSKNMLRQSHQGDDSTYYYYDLNGNLIDKRSKGETTTYEYDGFNRLTKAVLPDGRFQTNEYNALDQRTETMENGVVRQYAYNGRNVIMETDPGGKKRSTYIRGLELISKTNNKDQMCYYLHNRHGDITEIVDKEGKRLNKYEYDPFGNLKESIERIDNQYKYAGERYDSITEKYYLRARYYDPHIGRFTQEDTYRGDGLNLYAYVSNNPLKYVDPSGHGKDGAIINSGIPGVVDPEEMVASGLDNLRSEYIVLYDPAYEEEIESRLREEYLESSLLGKSGVIIKSLGHAAAKRYRYAKARYQVGMYESLGIDYETSEKALDSSMSYIAGEVVIGSLAKGYQWTKSLKARSKKISTFAKGTGKLKYDDRVLRRMAEDKGTHHNFPKVFDETIVSKKPYVTRANGRVEHLMQGTINKQEGIYHITLKGDIIKHRSFIPKSDWVRYSKRWELPTWDKIAP